MGYKYRIMIFISNTASSIARWANRWLYKKKRENAIGAEKMSDRQPPVIEL
jgi:hypothetical protein